jgi:hypothetical protein
MLGETMLTCAIAVSAAQVSTAKDISLFMV